MSDFVAPQQIEMEQNVLGAMMTTSVQATNAVKVEAGLEPDHFYLDRHRTVCRAIYQVADRLDGNTVPDELLVRAELERTGADTPPDVVAELASSTFAPGNLMLHAHEIVSEAKWRVRKEAIGVLEGAIKARDEEAIARTEEMITHGLGSERTTKTPADLWERARQIIEGGAGEPFPFPIQAMNELTAGGLRRSEHHVIAGHSSHGKSMWLDQLLAYWAGGDLRVHLYVNEMHLDGRIIRLLTKATSVKYSSVALNKTTEHERDALMRNVEDALPFGITDCTGWSVSKISNHIRLNRWDVAAVDMLHLIPHENESDLATISRKLTETAHLVDCLVISAAHLNEARTMTAVKPRPTLGDIRGSGMIKNNADSVSFVWREQDFENGQPLPEAEMLLTKVRNGIPGVVPVELDPRDLSFYARRTQ